MQHELSVSVSAANEMAARWPPHFRIQNACAAMTRTELYVYVLCARVRSLKATAS